MHAYAQSVLFLEKRRETSHFQCFQLETRRNKKPWERSREAGVVQRPLHKCIAPDFHIGKVNVGLLLNRKVSLPLATAIMHLTLHYAIMHRERPTERLNWEPSFSLSLFSLTYLRIDIQSSITNSNNMKIYCEECFVLVLGIISIK